MPTKTTPDLSPSPMASAEAVGATVRPTRYETAEGREAIDLMRDLCRWYVVFCEDSGEEGWDDPTEVDEDEEEGEEEEGDEDWNDDDDADADADSQRVAELVAMGDTMFEMHCLLTALKYRSRAGKKAGESEKEAAEKGLWYTQMARHVRHENDVHLDPRHARANFEPYVYQEPSDETKASFLAELGDE